MRLTFLSEAHHSTCRRPGNDNPFVYCGAWHPSRLFVRPTFQGALAPKNFFFVFVADVRVFVAAVVVGARVISILLFFLLPRFILTRFLYVATKADKTRAQTARLGWKETAKSIAH